MKEDSKQILKIRIQKLCSWMADLCYRPLERCKKEKKEEEGEDVNDNVGALVYTYIDLHYCSNFLKSISEQMVSFKY